MKHISSVQNSLIKHLIQLQEKSRLRKLSQTFLFEGFREFKLALQGNYVIDHVYFDPSLIDEKVVLEQINSNRCTTISREVYKKLAYRDATEGILVVAKMKNHDLSTLKLTKNPLILVAEAIEKPGNIGALLRTADAANLDAVILADAKTELYNQNTIRSSVGCLFTVPVATGTSEEIINYLQEHAITFYAAALQDAEPYYLQDFNKPTAIVMGTEDVGLTAVWRQAAAKNIIIPMQGTIDSMNVSTSASVLIFEAKRQREFK